MESAELKLTTLGSVDSIISESQAVGATTLNYIIFEDTNLYRGGEIDKMLLQDYDQFWRDGGLAPDPDPPPPTTDVLLPAVAARSTGAFVNGETIVGQTSRATAIVRVEDINANSRLFISSQNDFVIGEQIIGSTSNASGVISDYTANPVQNIQQLMEYADVDDTIDSFFDQFKEAFLRTIPRDLTSGVNERNLLKNIKDLYRAKGTRKGHELFFRILLNEDITLSYPKTDMIRPSDGQWSEDQILRITKGDDTILMEDTTDSTGDIFILNEDGGQVMTQDSVEGTSDLLKLVGQEITQRAIEDISILPGGVYYDKGFSIINEATALVDSVKGFKFGGQDVYELVLSNGSLDGTFATGHTITATSNANPDLTISGKLVSIVTSYNIPDSSSSQYFAVTDTLGFSATNGNDAGARIESLTSGDVRSIIVDSEGSGYSIGDPISVNNANTNGSALTAQISVVNGGIAPEAGDLIGEWGIELETNTGPGDVLLEDSTGSVSNYVEQQEAYNMNAVDHIILEDYTIFSDSITGDKIVQDAGTGNGEITDVVITSIGEGYTKTPILTVSGTLTISSATGLFTIGETITGSNSTATGSVMSRTLTKVVYKPLTGVFNASDVITGGTSAYTASVDSVAIGTGATIYAKGTGVGEIRDVTILDAGVHYTDTVVVTGFTNFLCTNFTGVFVAGETVTGQTSGATGVFESVDADRNILKLSNVTGTFTAGHEKSGETVEGFYSSATAVIDSYKSTSLKANHGTLGETSGRFLNEDGFLDERTKRIQDSYYYQDYSYVVKSSNSINTWRDQLLASVHPAGWAVFGQVDISTVVQSIANITSITGLGPIMKVIYTMLLGRRLGTTDQLPINPTPAVGVHDPADYGNSFRISGSTPGPITKGALITGDTSGATATAILDTTNDHGVNLLYYELLAGGDAPGAPGSVPFEAGEDITMTGAYAGTATIVNIHGLQGFRDVTLYRYVKIIKPPVYMTGDKYGFAPNLGDAQRWKFTEGMVSSANSSRTFGSMAVYPVYLNMLTTITSAINDAVATIPVAATDNLPTQGTIKLGTEEITYTGRSSASGAGNLTGCTRGANSTTPASHLINANLTLVRLARSQTGASGYRLSDWATDERGVALTIGDITTYPQRRNYISPPTEITIWKT
ncbi:uncharacterized protein METZ01_LOCUS65285 [marine metagenome]|uniref:Uncharacterized protein n=1 Tax=marine metagenome TaxID=408172 RepID=A0A381TA84_9ZZZZ